RQRFPLFEFSTGHGYEPTRGRDGCGRRASQGASLRQLLANARYRRLARVGGVEADKLSENFRLIIPSADKELYLQDRCRRSTGNGYRCRPDGPWRGERIPGQRQTLRLLPPMETAQVQ